MVNGITEAPLDSEPSVHQGSYYFNALTCLDFDPSNPPLADLLRLYHGLEGHWLVASPIHWEVTHNDAMIVATNEELALSDEESRAWFLEIAAFLQSNDIESFYHDPYTWLLKIDHKPTISSKSVYAMLHQSLMPALNTLDEKLYWQRLITELQMYLSSHPLNNNRQNKLAINGLWFWGEGEFQFLTEKQVFTDDEIFLSVSAKTDKPFQPLTQTSSHDKDSLLLIKYPHQKDIALLQEKTQKNTVQWYWNNLAYVKHPIRWWSRLWRS
ncbi:hypothetical protein [Legionella brunensis]|uniref:hypothetical protein n=1 Tax=Legionella brunensis TaxID=29422 RepID=UPI00138F8D54|nr:hypothetical protein [Legionella brunensis]